MRRACNTAAKVAHSHRVVARARSTTCAGGPSTRKARWMLWHSSQHVHGSAPPRLCTTWWMCFRRAWHDAAVMSSLFTHQHANASPGEGAAPTAPPDRVHRHNSIARALLNDVTRPGVGRTDAPCVACCLTRARPLIKPPPEAVFRACWRLHGRRGRVFACWHGHAARTCECALRHVAPEDCGCLAAVVLSSPVARTRAALVDWAAAAAPCSGRYSLLPSATR